MKNYAKLGLGILAFGFLLSVLGAIVIRAQAPSNKPDSTVSSVPHSAASTANTSAAVTSNTPETSQASKNMAASTASAAAQK